MVSGVGPLTAVMMLLADVTGAHADYGYALRLGVIAAALLAAPFVVYLLAHRHDPQRGGQAFGSTAGDGHLRVRDAGDGQWLVGRCRR